MFEHHTEPLLPRRRFYGRMARSGATAAVLLGGCLLLGVVGYHLIAGQEWVDAFLNASMILSGMGPVGELHSDAAKIFAGCYALLSGVVFISTMGVLIAAPVHRMMHKFHLADEEHEEGKGSRRPGDHAKSHERRSDPRR